MSYNNLTLLNKAGFLAVTFVLLSSGFQGCKPRNGSDLENADLELKEHPLRITLKKNDKVFYPHSTYNQTAKWFTSLVYEPLVQYIPQRPEYSQNILAESWKISDDGGSVIITLKGHIVGGSGDKDVGTDDKDIGTVVKWHDFTVPGVDFTYPAWMPFGKQDIKEVVFKDFYFSAEDVDFTYRLIANAHLKEFEPARVFLTKDMRMAIGNSYEELQDLKNEEMSHVFIDESKVSTSALDVKPYEKPEPKKRKDLPYFVKFAWNKPNPIALRQALGIQIMPKHILEFDLPTRVKEATKKFQENTGLKGGPKGNDRDLSIFTADRFLNGLLAKNMVGTGPVFCTNCAGPVYKFRKNLTYKHGPPVRFEELEIRFPGEGIKGVEMWGATPDQDYVDLTLPSSAQPVRQKKTANPDIFDNSSSDYAKKYTGPAQFDAQTNFGRNGYYSIVLNPMRTGPVNGSKSVASMPTYYNDPRVRQALAYAIDYERLMKLVVGGKAIRVNQPFVPEISSPFSQTENAPIQTNLEKTKSLLTQAGWKYSPVQYEEARDTSSFGDHLSYQPAYFRGGWQPTDLQGRVQSNFKLTITSDGNSFFALKLAEELSKSLREVGINAVDAGEDSAKFEKGLIYREYEAALVFNEYRDLADICTQFRRPPLFGYPATLNFSWFSNSDVTEACKNLETQRVTDRLWQPSDPVVTAMFNKIHGALSAMQPVIFLFAPPATAVVSEDMRRLFINTTGPGDFSLFDLLR